MDAWSSQGGTRAVLVIGARCPSASDQPAGPPPWSFLPSMSFRARALPVVGLCGRTARGLLAPDAATTAPAIPLFPEHAQRITSHRHRASFLIDVSVVHPACTAVRQ